MVSFLNSLVEGASDAIFVAEVVTGKIVYVNPAACTLFECTSEYLIGKLQPELHPPEDLQDVLQKFKEFTSNDKYKETTSRILTKNGNKKRVLITAANLFEINNKKYAAAYFKDISYIQKLEEIAFDQSHLVRRPLANILGMARLLSEKKIDDLDEEDRKLMAVLYKEALVLDKIVKSVASKSNAKNQIHV